MLADRACRMLHLASDTSHIGITKPKPGLGKNGNNEYWGDPLLFSFSWGVIEERGREREGEKQKKKVQHAMIGIVNSRAGSAHAGRCLYFLWVETVLCEEKVECVPGILPKEHRLE